MHSKTEKKHFHLEAFCTGSVPDTHGRDSWAFLEGVEPGKCGFG